MGAQVLFCFTAFLVIFVWLESAFACPSNVKNATDSDSGKVIVKGNYNAVNLYPEKDVKTALSQLQKELESLDGRMDARGGGALLYMGYIGMCRCEGYGFQAVYSRIVYINQSVWV